MKYLSVFVFWFNSGWLYCGGWAFVSFSFSFYYDQFFVCNIASSLCISVFGGWKLKLGMSQFDAKCLYIRSFFYHQFFVCNANWVDLVIEGFIIICSY